jgi:prolyl oligopeptidase
MPIRLSRRHFVALSAVLGMKAASATEKQGGPTPVPAAPVARVAPVVDEYFGEKITDNYRWMENAADPEWLPFLKGQNAHARAVLDRIPGRDALLARIRTLSGNSALVAAIQRAGGMLFYQQRPPGANSYQLLVSDASGNRVLVDPAALNEGLSHTSLDWWQASPDGSFVVYGLSPNGSEDSVLHVLDVKTGKQLQERIPNTEVARPSWLDDSSGFFYTQLTHTVNTPERYLDSRARFHRLHTDPATDPILVKRGLDAKLTFDTIQFPNIVTFPGASHALLTLSDVRQEARLLIAPVADIVAGKPRWVPVADFNDLVTDWDIDDETLYLLSSRDAPRGQVIATAVARPEPNAARVMVAQGHDVIESIGRARDGLYLRIMDGGNSRLRRLASDGTLHEIAMPFPCTIDNVAVHPREDGALLVLAGWLKPQDIWQIKSDGSLTALGANPDPGIDVSPYTTESIKLPARDNTEIPVSLIYKKGLKLDGKTPAWISAYGSYGISAYTPNFAGRLLALVDAGFIVGYANVRGGGEYGREWHKAGQLQNKPNTWRDLIDVCEGLCARKYTSTDRLAIGGRSAGGITVGRALTERPDLFAAVIDGVGWSNPLRYVAEQNGYTEEPEWGAIREKSGFLALKAIDSYQAVQDGVDYPAVLLTTGVTDPRVAPFHVAKMAARLQAASRSGKPVLLRVDFDAGHGVGSTRAQQDKEAADTYAFLLWRTGVAGYQPA